MTIKTIIDFFFIPNLNNTQLITQLITSTLVPIIMLFIDCICKVASYNSKSVNNIQDQISDKIYPGKTILVRTIKIYEQYNFSESIPAALLSNNVWGLTFIPFNINQSICLSVLLCYVFFIFLPTVVLYVISFFGIKNIKSLLIFERIFVCILIIVTYLLIFIFPKIGIAN